MPFLFEGVIPAVWTPTGGGGELLRDEFRRNIEFITGTGVDALLILGSTGEFVHFSVEERKRILEAAVEFADGKPVAVNISHTNPRAVAELGRQAKEAGAGAVTLLPPWFFPLSDEDVAAFYGRAGDGLELPLGLYNFPNLTGKKLTGDLVRRIARETKVSGLKQSGGEFAEHAAVIAAARELGFSVLTGWDTHIAEAIALGAKGCIGGLGNFVPELMLQVQRASASGRAQDAEGAAKCLKRVGEIVNSLEFPLNVAAAMEARGLEPGIPKQAVSKESRGRYETLREQMRALFAELNIARA